MLLCEYSYYSEAWDVSANDNTRNSSNFSGEFFIQKTAKMPSPIEYLLAFWVFSFLLDEVFQVNVLFKLKKWVPGYCY
jgi:hypothetical protein